MSQDEDQTREVLITDGRGYFVVPLWSAKRILAHQEGKKEHYNSNNIYQFNARIPGVVSEDPDEEAYHRCVAVCPELKGPDFPNWRILDRYKVVS
jgi:hypothetical protein